MGMGKPPAQQAAPAPAPIPGQVAATTTDSNGRPISSTTSPVPQPDSPQSIEAQQEAATVAKSRDGASAQLLSGQHGVLGDADTRRRVLGGGSQLLGQGGGGGMR